MRRPRGRVHRSGDVAGVRVELRIEERGEGIDARLEAGLQRDVFDLLAVHDHAATVPQALTVLLAVAQARILSFVRRYAVAEEEVAACR